MISIITPIYNRRHLLDAAYQSLLRQSNKDFEWIVIDDGSTDAADELCLLNFPIVLTQILLIRIGKKLGISKVQKYI